MKILVTPTSLQPEKHSPALNKLKLFTNDLVFNTTGRPLTEDELIPLLSGCDGYIAGLDFITEKVISSCNSLKVISRYGAGVDRVDIEAAQQKEIIVTNTPGANAQAVGELTLALTMALARRIPYLHEQTKSGQWLRSTGIELKGKTMGILGLGAIGRVTAKLAAGIGMQVIAYDPYINTSYCKQEKIQAASMEEVFSTSDVIAIHIPLTDASRHLINEETINQMKPGVILINSSRGGIIDETAAYLALKSGRLGGLGLDAFEVEPPSASPLFDLDNVILTPHTGAHTKEATFNMAECAVQNLIDVLSGKPCPNIIKS